MLRDDFSERINRVIRGFAVLPRKGGGGVNFTVRSKCVRDSTEHQDRPWRLIYMHVSQTEQEQLGHDNTVATLQVTKPMNPVRLLAGVEISSKTSPLAGDLGRFRCRKND